MSKFDKNNILMYGLLMQKGPFKMRISVDITPAYDKNRDEILTKIISHLHCKKLSNINTTSQEGYILSEL